MVDTVTTNFNPDEPVEEIVVDDNQTTDDNQETESRPEGLPENFKSVAELAEALNNTKAELTRTQQANKVDPKTASPAEAETAATQAGVDFAKLTDEYNENQKLSDDTYTMLSSKGFSREVVDAYIEGQKAVSDRFSNEMYDITGGQESFGKVIEWAKDNLSASEINAYNTAVMKDPTTAKLLLSGMTSRYNTQNPSEPNLISGNPAGSNSDIFKSSHDMVKAMQDPRYWNDPDYQAEIQKKSERSLIAGTI